jgi:hypothetical protein
MDSPNRHVLSGYLRPVQTVGFSCTALIRDKVYSFKAIQHLHSDGNSTL